MFKVVREMTEAPRTFPPGPPRDHTRQGSGHGVSGLDTPRAGCTDPVIGSVLKSQVNDIYLTIGVSLIFPLTTEPASSISLFSFRCANFPSLKKAQ